MGDVIEPGPAHAGVIAAMHGACLGEAGGGWNEESVADILSMPGAFGFIVSTKEEPTGFILGRVAGDEAEIISVGVLEKSRRRGLASCLLARTVERVKKHGGKRMFLEVATDNDAAAAFYHSHGFIEGGLRKDYYRRPDGRVDALILCLNLDS